MRPKRGSALLTKGVTLPSLDLINMGSAAKEETSCESEHAGGERLAPCALVRSLDEMAYIGLTTGEDIGQNLNRVSVRREP
jgi:hypothetical protein